MIINIRGTSGSGKSTLMRNITGLYKSKTTFKEKERKRPIGYVFHHPSGGKDLAVVGHYETPCGGCDTIMSIDHIYELVRQSHAAGFNVLFEGLLLSAEIKRTLALHQDGLPLLVVGLNTSIEECLYSVNSRRRLSFEKRLERVNKINLGLAEKEKKLRPVPEYRGDVRPKNTESKHKATIATMKRLSNEGLNVEWHDRESSFIRIREVLEI